MDSVVNEAKRDELIEKYVEWDERLGYEMFKLSWYRRQCQLSYYKYIHFYSTIGNYPVRKGTGEEELTALLNLTEWSTRSATYESGLRSVWSEDVSRKTISTYLFAIPDFDGKMRTTCFMCLGDWSN